MTELDAAARSRRATKCALRGDTQRGPELRSRREAGRLHAAQSHSAHAPFKEKTAGLPGEGAVLHAQTRPGRDRSSRAAGAPLT